LVFGPVVIQPEQITLATSSASLCPTSGGENGIFIYDIPFFHKMKRLQVILMRE
jgi:hypothetical protein